MGEVNPAGDPRPDAAAEKTIGTASTIRDSYLAAIRAADRGDLTALIELHARFAG